MSKKEEITVVIDEIVKYYCQAIRSMQLMIEKGNSNYGGLDIEETVAIFKKNAKGWLRNRQKLNAIEDEKINACTDEELFDSGLFEERGNIEKVAKSSQDICQSLYGYHYE